ncbi:hypothetical protein [Candidatus Villigracilis saccharophilus]|uniref:hypothetical protein n=1 Tax=Candidatus Villigracilis saccharophilus TaxID=3140684 RepID=UPI0031EB6A54
MTTLSPWELITQFSATRDAGGIVTKGNFFSSDTSRATLFHTAAQPARHMAGFLSSSSGFL